MVKVMTEAKPTALPVRSASHLTQSEEIREEHQIFAESKVTVPPLGDATSTSSEYADKVHERAVTVTVLLSEILKRPATMRRWGINE